MEMKKVLGIIFLLCLTRLIACNQIKIGYILAPKYGASSADNDTVKIGSTSNANFSNGITLCLKFNFHYRTSVRVFYSDNLKLDLEDQR